ncbi:ATP-dependent DNA ligase [Metabacillus bambusae]|uniref:ATP-dependent DNA ligase family profile domain-containing protein n=1 Tax=Metabacillus bambusae TaxID=2795218 RepID=A0ABS3MYP2_9BACI|nr:hypothetical protein [Metabacillus bambusae]MBO1511124.1 hypothetical protein [Metabacillus bambusae]
MNFDSVQKQGLEGLVLKLKDSPYEIGKHSQAWLKVINYQYQDVYISGLRKSEFGHLLAGQKIKTNRKVESKWSLLFFSVFT